MVDHAPEWVTMDGHASYPRAVREIVGVTVQHWINKYLNHRLEQDHQGVKQRYYLMRGIISAPAPSCENQSHSQSSGELREMEWAPAKAAVPVLVPEAVRDWEERFAPLIADQLQTKRRGQAGKSWYVDETSLKIHGKWCSLSRAIGQDGNLVDSRLSEKRNMKAAQQFFRQAIGVVGHAPETVTTDGHASYPRARREVISGDVLHRTNTYLNTSLQPGPSRDQTTLLPDARLRNV